MARRLAVLLVPAALAAGLALPLAAGGATAKKKTVAVVDNAFVPPRVTVRPGTRVTWKWDAANTQTHNVKLVRAPRGVRKFTSPAAAAGITYTRVFRVKGTYRLLCTFHASVMKQTIVVK